MKNTLYLFIFFSIYITGNYNLTADDVSGTWDMIGHVVDDTWIVEHFNVTPSFGNFKMHFNNLIEQNKEMSKYLINLIITLFFAIF